jgi:integrase
MSRADIRWLEFFDRNAAIEAVAAHVAALPGSRTPEQYTKQVYGAGLQYFLDWIGDELPTQAHMKRFIAHLSLKHNHRTGNYGLSAATISSKYLAPVRLYLTNLANQHIPAPSMDIPYIMQCKDQLRIAAQVKNPRPETTSRQSALYRYGVRLTVRQMNKVLRAIDRQDLVGKRDYALLLTAFYTGLRLAELQRITSASLTQDESGSWIVTVRRKRSNYDPATIPEQCVDAINDYIDAYNEGLGEDDPRRITDQTAVWQPLTRSGNYLKIGAKVGQTKKGRAVIYQPDRGMSTGGIAGIIRRRGKISPHDTRRTMAANAARKKAPLQYISRQLGHASLATTDKYIGDSEDPADCDMSRYFTIG